MHLLKLSKDVVVEPTSRSVNKIKRELKFDELSPIMKSSVIGKFIKAFRKKKTKTIDGVDTVWGVYFDHYALVYLKYEHIPGGITPCKVMFLTRQGTPLCESTSLVRLIPMIKAEIRRRKRSKRA